MPRTPTPALRADPLPRRGEGASASDGPCGRCNRQQTENADAAHDVGATLSNPSSALFPSPPWRERVGPKGRGEGAAAGQGSPRTDVPHTLAITDLSSTKPDSSGTSPAMTSEWLAAALQSIPRHLGHRDSEYPGSESPDGPIFPRPRYRPSPRYRPTSALWPCATINAPANIFRDNCKGICLGNGGRPEAGHTRRPL